jgi:predicted DNA-binding transcriptional regulator AlpA
MPPIPPDQKSPHPVETPNVETPERTETELWERKTVLKFFGGDRPLHVSTLYRGIKGKIYPPPINVAPNVVRWIGHECRAARQELIAARDKPKPPQRRGRPRKAAAVSTATTR